MKILVIGEQCVDHFIYGSSDRKSPEGGAPVFLAQYEIKNMGMAMNVANNIKAIDKGVWIDTICSNSNIQKIRYVDVNTNKLYLRVDKNDNVDPFDVIDLPDDLSQYNMVIISDYCKGFLSEETINAVSALHDLTILDTKKKLGEWCKYVKFIKLNRNEYEKNWNYIKSNRWIADKLIITLDEDGVQYKDVYMETERVRNPDVSGAGDTFVAAFAYRYLRHGNIIKAIEYANECATCVVKKRGVSVC